MDYTDGAERPRIAPLLPDDPIAGQGRLGAEANCGRPLNIFRTMAHHPALFGGWRALGQVFFRPRGLIPARERELVILRMGWRCRAEYEFGVHTLQARAAGLADPEIERLAAPGTDGWPADDRALIELCDELHADDTVTDPTWRALSARWGDAALLELIVLAGFYRLVSGVLNSAGVALEPGNPGWPASAAGTCRRAPRDL